MSRNTGNYGAPGRKRAAPDNKDLRDGAVDNAGPLLSESDERAKIFRENPYLALAGATVTFTGRLFDEGDDKLHRQVRIQFPECGLSEPLRASPNERVGQVYFVGPEHGPIKIGFSCNFKARFNDLRLMSPFPLICHAVIPGLSSLERGYHEQFSAHRLHGEWFAFAPEIAAEIARIKAEAKP